MIIRLLFALLCFLATTPAIAQKEVWHPGGNVSGVYSSYESCIADEQKEWLRIYSHVAECATFSPFDRGDIRGLIIGGCAGGALSCTRHVICPDGSEKQPGLECPKPPEKCPDGSDKQPGKDCPKKCPPKDSIGPHYPYDTPIGYRCEGGCIVEVSRAVVDPGC